MLNARKTLLLFVLGTVFFSRPCDVFAAKSSDTAKSELSRVTSQIEKARSQHKALRQKAALVSKEILDVRKKMVTAARSVQEQEESLDRLEQKLHELEARQEYMKNRLEIRREQRIRVLAALQTLAFKPTEALLMQPLSPQDTLRSALLLREAVPRLEYSTEGLKKDLDLVASLTGAIRAQSASIRKTAVRLEEKRRDMDVLIKKKTKLQSAFESESSRARRKAEALAQQASDLKDLLARLDRESKKRGKTGKTDDDVVSGAFMTAKGRIPYPVKGKIVSKFGDLNEAGAASKGISLATRPNAQVISPYDGRVLFAGPFRGYGELLIIEHGDGYHTLLAGLGRLDTSVGQSLLAGEPVGVMAESAKPVLYMEFRKNGQPVNPTSWLDSRKGKG